MCLYEVYFKVDGKTPSLACGTTGGKVFVHSPHDTPIGDSNSSSLRFLNINRKITAMAAGKYSIKVKMISELTIYQEV